MVRLKYTILSDYRFNKQKDFLFSIDSTYTERYMGMPNVTDNYKGYEEGDLSKHADQLRDKQFLLVSIINSFILKF